MSTKYNVGWLRDEQNQIFIPFTYPKSIKLDDESGSTLQTTVNTVGEHTIQLKNQGDRITNLENGTTPAGTASKTVGKLTVGNSSFNGSEDVTVTAKDLGITGALVYRGISTTQITNGGSELPKINDEYVALSDLDAGNIVLYKTDGGEIYQEFVWTGDSWELLGDEGSYALKTIEIVAGDGLVQTGTSLRDNIEIRVNPDGVTITTLDDKIALKIINPEVTSEDIVIETNGVKTFTLPSVTVDKYGRVTAVANKTIKLNDVTDKINTLISDVDDLESALGTVIQDIAGDSTKTDNIVPRINTLETRTKYVYAADDSDTAFAVVGGDGNIAMQVDANGITAFDFKIDDGTNPDISVKESLSNLKTTTLPGIESSLKTINETKIVAGDGLGQTGETISDKTITLKVQTDRGLDVTSDKVGHTNSVTAGTAKGTDGVLEFSGKISIPSITYDKHGHITSATTTTVTLPSDSDLTSKIKSINDTSIIAGQGLANGGKIGDGDITLNIGKGTGIVVEDDKISLEAISPALTTGTTYGSNATSLGASVEKFNIPQLKVDTYGRVTSIANKEINITEVNSNIKTNADAIATKAAKTDLDAAVKRIAANETAITTKATKTDLNNAVERISANETAINTLQANDNEQNTALNSLNTKIEIVKNNIAGSEPEEENGVANPDYYNWNILPRISETETRVQYINELDDTNFAIVGKDGNVAFQVNADGTTKSFDFITATGNTINTNATNIADTNNVLNEFINTTAPNTYKKIQTIISSPGASGNETAFIDTISQNANGEITATKKNIPVMTGANASTAGAKGLVPAPAAGYNTRFLRGDGTWAVVSTADEKVQQDANTTSESNHPILATVSASPTSGTDAKTIYNTGVSITPKTSAINANVFNGGLNTNSKSIVLTEDINYFATAPESTTLGELLFEEMSDGQLVPTNGSAGQVLTRGSTAGELIWADNNITTAATSTKILVAGVPEGVTNTSSIYYNNEVFIEDNVLMGAAWNDYAEYRICKDNYKPGQVVCENGDDTLSISTERLQPGAEVVSDTFGFAIGETAEATCPIAVSGRVLAYTYEPREEFKAGDPVCAGPNGTVSKMTREEVREYPDRMIGTVSAIPSYETWNNKVIINNRIWIKIK